MRQVDSQLREELNAIRDYNLKMEEKKAKTPKQDAQEQRIKVNMAKEKNGGQMWMRKEELPREEEKEMAWDEP